MFFLVGTLGITAVALYSYSLYKYLYGKTNNRFDDIPIGNDEYLFFCHKIYYKDGQVHTSSELLSEEEVLEMNDKSPISFIITEYMYNKKFMKHISYDTFIPFPFYELDVEPLSKNDNILDKVFINDVEVSSYIKPFLGPKQNFYKDLSNSRIHLEDVLVNFPNELVLDHGIMEMFNTRGERIVKTLPCGLSWKPKSGDLDKSSFLTNFINNNETPLGYTVIPQEVKKEM